MGQMWGPSLVVAMGPHTGGQLWTHRAEQGQVLDVQRWQAINGKIPHRNLPFVGHRASLVLFTHAATCSNTAAPAIESAAQHGFPMPAIPILSVPSVDELKFIRMGVTAAAEALRQMCACTVEVADKVHIPTNVKEAEVNEETAYVVFQDRIANRSAHFLHKSVLLGFFYAALIMSFLQPASAYVKADQMYVAAYVLQPMHLNASQQVLTQQMTCDEALPTDAVIGSDHIPRMLCQPWMPELYDPATGVEPKQSATETMAAAMHANHSAYCIFGDQKTASASLQRKVAMLEDDAGDETWLRHLEHCGYTQS